MPTTGKTVINEGGYHVVNYQNVYAVHHGTGTGALTLTVPEFVQSSTRLVFNGFEYDPSKYTETQDGSSNYTILTLDDPVRSGEPYWVHYLPVS